MIRWYQFIAATTSLYAHIPTQQETVNYRKQLDGQIFPKCISTPEGAFVYYYHPEVASWLEQPITPNVLKTIQSQLGATLEIPFTKEGFTQAVSKPEGHQFGDVSYSAVWVRDSCWHYYGLKIHHPENAGQLIKSLLQFYSTDEQIARFIAVINKPEIANPAVDPRAHMNVPLIRFSTKTLSHYHIDGKVQEWNHLQYDSHGLFLLALSDALSSGIVSLESLTPEHFTVLALFPAYFTEMNYVERADTGPWEEILQYNASSAGLVAAGIKRIMDVIHANPELERGFQNALIRIQQQFDNHDLYHKIKTAITSENIENLYQKGMQRVEMNLRHGGEAPNVHGHGVDRRADSALFFLCLVEHTPFFNHPNKIKEILNINSSLIGPYGIYRYKYDPYQTTNYWIEAEVISPISGAQTPLLEMLSWWKKGYMPHRQPFDAQWFFDSCIADIYYHLSMLENDTFSKAYYLKHGDIHLKRALGQLSGIHAIASNGNSLKPLQLSESINTVWDPAYSIRALPSPISPLNWAKAALQMALARAHAAHAE